MTTKEKIPYGRLRGIASEAGGSLVYVRTGSGNRWGKWVLTIGNFSMDIPATGEMRFPLLDACYTLKDGHTYQTWQDRTNVIDPAGLAHLFSRLSLKTFNNFGAFDTMPVAE